MKHGSRENGALSTSNNKQQQSIIIWQRQRHQHINGSANRGKQQHINMAAA